MRRRTIALFAAAAAVMAVSLTGCGERLNQETEAAKKEEEVIIASETEAVTEAAPITEAPQTETQPVTEVQTETQPATEVQTEQKLEMLPVEDELAEEWHYDTPVILYASDDLNVRETPDVNADNIFDSFDQGEEVPVYGETANWYVVVTDNGTEEGATGYVYKANLSGDVVAPKSEEERAADTAQDATQNAVTAETTAQAETTAPAEASAALSTGTAAQATVTDQSADLSSATTYDSSQQVTLAGDANLRASAAQNSDIVGTVPGGTTVNAIGESGDYYVVDYNGKQGYVHKNLIKK